MTRYLTETQILGAIPGLTRNRLIVFIEARLVLPLRQDASRPADHLFRPVDCARVQLLCDLADDLALDDAALGVVITLIDQLHATRRDLLAIARAVRAEAPDVRARIGGTYLATEG